MPAKRELVVVPILLALFTAVLAWGLVAEAGPRQGPAKKQRVEEEDDKPKQRRVEEEDDRTTSAGVSRLADEAEKRAKGKAVAASDLGAAARAATHPRIQALFNDLKVPHDRISLRAFGSNRGQQLWVEPLADYIADIHKHTTTLNLNVLDRETGKSARTESMPPSHINVLRWYEQVAMDEVKEFRSHNFTGYDTGNPLYLGRYDQLAAAEQALAAVLLYHRSARERGTRKGDGWEAVGNELSGALLGVELAKVDLLGDAKSWDQAFALTRRLVETYVRREDRKRIAGPLGELLSKALKDPNYSQSRMKEARTQLRFIEEQFPGSDVGKPIRESLRAEAASLFKRAQELLAEDKKREALPLLKQAEEIWPELPGLKATRMRSDDEYQVLSVGMRELPIYLSPSRAFTDAELRAVELQFESLVALVPEGEGVMSYRPALAERRPTVVPRGRLFQLPRQARWSNGEPLRVDDLRTTVSLLRDGTRPTGRSPAWGELLAGVDSGADASQVKVRLRQGLLDPLGAMSFKVLPRYPDPTTDAFARKPIGSGPFVFAGQGQLEGHSYVRFEVNPHYGVRDDKRGLPRIREIQFSPTTNPVADLQNRRIQIAMDLTAEQAVELSKQSAFEVPMPSSRLPNRRVWFLAVNHRHTVLSSADIRIALARAIPRELLLDEHFRKGLGRKVHRSLSGPYPAGTWACDPSLVNRKDKTVQDPHDPERARARWKLGLTKLNRSDVTLTLKYPAGDAALSAAMTALCDEVKKELPGLTIRPESRPPHELRQDVEGTQNYELAYYHHDFVDETFWLSPLLGHQGRGGAENYLGYTGSLVGNAEAVMTLRNFSEVRKYAHAIHRQLLETDMPLIPLWQLDPLCAYDKRAMNFGGAADPLPWFHEVERWRVLPR